MKQYWSGWFLVIFVVLQVSVLVSASYFSKVNDGLNYYVWYGIVVAVVLWLLSFFRSSGNFLIVILAQFVLIGITALVWVIGFLVNDFRIITRLF